LTVLLGQLFTVIGRILAQWLTVLLCTTVYCYWQDSRPEQEYNISHIPGSVRVDFESDGDNIAKTLPQLKQSGTINSS